QLQRRVHRRSDLIGRVQSCRAGNVKTMTRRPVVVLVTIAAIVGLVACGTPEKPANPTPDAASVRDSFAQQLAANRAVTDFRRSGDDLTFSGPGTEGGTAKWRVHIDSVGVQKNDDPAQPYKGVVASSWYADNRLMLPRGNDANLPLELTNNGLAQE